MHLVGFEYTKPTNDSAFEDMCARVYGEVFGDPLPKINGRQGQAQSGVDVFVMAAGARYGIQCKRYADGALKFKHVEAEVAKADKKKARIARLILATTATSDARVVEQVHELSDARVAAGTFPVEVEFWEDICRHIASRPRLLNDYAPNSPGGAYYRQEARDLEILGSLRQVGSQIEEIATALPGPRPDSLNKLVSGELDYVNTLLKATRYEDASQALKRVGRDLSLFDAHQKARWFLQRGLCTWHQQSGEAAAADFLKAFEIYPHDDKMATARIRGLFLSGNFSAAVEEGREALERFPASHQVWLAYANARMLAGAAIDMPDVPQAFRAEPDVLQLVAWARRRAGDFGAAVKISQTALAQSTAGFYVRLAAIGIVVQAMAADPVAAVHGLHPAVFTQALENSIAALEPWNEHIFAVQAPPSVEEAVVMLMYGYMLQSQPARALDLAAQATARGITSPRLIRAELEALRDAGRKGELIALASAHLPQLDDDGLVLLGEVAANDGKQEVVNAAAEAYRKRHLDRADRGDVFQAMRWVSAWRAPDADKAALLAEIRASNLQESSSLPLLQAASRILHEAGQEYSRDLDALVARVPLLAPVSEESDRVARMTAGDLLFELGQFQQASAYYESLTSPGSFSALHSRLLECYVQSGERRKAKVLLESFPDGWTSNDRARGAAIELGQQASDWAFLEPIAEIQRSRYPNQASSWLFNLLVLLRSGKMHAFHWLLARVPLAMESTVEQTAQLAGFEFRYGRADVGMRRIYAMYRGHVDDVAAAEAYFISLLAATEPLPNMDESLPQVGPGTSVTLREDSSVRITVTLDPCDVDRLPVQGEFYPSDSPLVAALLGRRVADTVRLPAGMAGTRTVHVEAITSSYRRLLAVAQETFTRSLQSPNHLIQVAIPQSHEGPDFSQMHSMLKAKTERSERAFRAYGEGPLTLGMLGKLLGHSAIDFITDWPSAAPPLFVCYGRQDEFDSARMLLSRSLATFVVDAATLTEFVGLGVERVLRRLGRVLVSTETLQEIAAQLEEARTDRAAGRAVDIGGRLAYVEASERQKALRVQFLERTLSAAQSCCEVAPAYGPETTSQEFRRVANLLHREEHAALLLAAERTATLLTSDGRLANIGRVFFQLQRVWPQPVLAKALDEGWITPGEYNLATARLFVANRSFISMNAGDLLAVCLQGTVVLRRGIELFKQQLASPSVVFASVAAVCLEFLARLASIPISVSAYTEILSHLCEAACRNPHATKSEFLDHLRARVAEVIENSEPLQIYPPLLEHRKGLVEAKARYMAKAIQEAERRGRAPAQPRSVQLEVLMCTRIPRIRSTPQRAETSAGSIEHQRDPQEGSEELDGPDRAYVLRSAEPR